LVKPRVGEIGLATGSRHYFRYHTLARYGLQCHRFAHALGEKRTNDRGQRGATEGSGALIWRIRGSAGKGGSGENWHCLSRKSYRHIAMMQFGQDLGYNQTHPFLKSRWLIAVMIFCRITASGSRPRAFG